jgi:hypothetical protein
MMHIPRTQSPPLQTDNNIGETGMCFDTFPARSLSSPRHTDVSLACSAFLDSAERRRAFCGARDCKGGFASKALLNSIISKHRRFRASDKQLLMVLS